MIGGSHAQVMKPVHVPSSRPQIPCSIHASLCFFEHRMHDSLDSKESIMSVSKKKVYIYIYIDIFGIISNTNLEFMLYFD